MKRIFLLLAFLSVGIALFSQNEQRIWRVNKWNTAFGRIVEPDDIVYVRDSANYWRVTVKQTAGKSMASASALSQIQKLGMDGNGINCKRVSITATQITQMYDTLVTLVAQPGSGKFIEYLDGVLIYDRTTANFTEGGGVYIGYDSFADVTDTITRSNAWGATGDKIYKFPKLNPAGGISLPVNTALMVGNKLRKFVKGTAAGTGTIIVWYRIHNSGL